MNVYLVLTVSKKKYFWQSNISRYSGFFLKICHFLNVLVTLGKSGRPVNSVLVILE